MNWLIRLTTLGLSGLIFIGMVGHHPVKGQTAAAVQETDEKKKLIEELAEMISNTQWTGKFTVDGQDAPPKAESYRIRKAEYQGDDKWIITARIAYGERDVTVPIPLEIHWAGTTPVITVDSLTIPPLGTFDARVVIRKGKYAGTWAHGEVGGHLFGKFVKQTDEVPSRRKGSRKKTSDAGKK